MANATATSCTLVNTALVIGGTLSGTWLVGMTLSGASVPPGVTIVSQSSGPAGGAGIYVVTANSANITTGEPMTGSLYGIMPFAGNAGAPQIVDMRLAAGLASFVVGASLLGPTAAPGAQYTHGTHAQALYDQNSRGTQVFKAAITSSSGRVFEFAATTPQYVDPPQPSVQRTLVKSTEVVNPNRQTIMAAPQQHDPSPYLQPNVWNPVVAESLSQLGQEYHFGTHQKAYIDSQNCSIVWQSLSVPTTNVVMGAEYTYGSHQVALYNNQQQPWITAPTSNQGWISTFCGASDQFFDWTNQGTFSIGVVNYGPGQAKSSPRTLIAIPQQDPTQLPPVVFRPPLVAPVSAPLKQLTAAPDRQDYTQPQPTVTRAAVAGPSKFPMRPTIQVPQQAYVDIFPMPFTTPVIGIFIPPTPPVVPNNCTNLWDFSGNWNWDFSGYPGWSWDGYEPTPLECAVTALAAVGVNVGQLTYACSNFGVPLGWVITGYVPFINPALAGQYIPLTISNGPCIAPTQVTVPNVVGLFYYDAQLAILDAGLRTAYPTWALSRTVLPQYVISQSLVAGTTVAAQSQMTIVVSGFTVLQQPGIPTPVP